MAAESLDGSDVAMRGVEGRRDGGVAQTMRADGLAGRLSQGGDDRPNTGAGQPAGSLPRRSRFVKSGPGSLPRTASQSASARRVGSGSVRFSLRAPLAENADCRRVEVEVVHVERCHFVPPQGSLKQEPDDCPIANRFGIPAPVEVAEQPR